MSSDVHARLGQCSGLVWQDDIDVLHIVIEGRSDGALFQLWDSCFVANPLLTWAPLLAHSPTMLGSFNIQYFRSDNTRYGTEWRGLRLNDDYHRLYFAAEGGAEIVYNGVEQDLRVGHTYLFPTTESFKYQCNGKLWLLNVCFKLTLASNLDVLELYPHWLELRTPDPDMVRWKMIEIGQRMFSPNFSDQLRARGLTMELISPHFMRSDMSKQHVRRQRYMKRMAPVLEHIHTAKGEKIQISELAPLANMSRSHFAKKFHETFKMSAQDYIRRHRIEQVKLDLRSSNTPISLIAERYGFSSPSHLTIEFRKFTGISPRDYRGLDNHFE